MDILDRIKKLLRLAQNAGSEQEAALAAERAAQMMAQHEIHEAMIDLDEPAEARVKEEIVERHEVTTTKKRVAWHMRIASGVAYSFGAHVYWDGGRIAMFGRLSAVQAASYTTHYLIRQIETICDELAPSPEHSRGYRNAFRLGCARRVEERVREAARAEREHVAVKLMPVAARPAAKRAEPDEIPMPPPEAGVIARIEKDRAEVNAAYEKHSAKWGKVKVGVASSGDGLKAGKAAGDRVRLGGRTRGGLPRGQGVLP